MRSILKRACVIPVRSRHHTLLSLAEDHHGDTASNDPNTSTCDVTREVRTGLTQFAIRASSSEDIGGDVAMREDSVDENSARHPSSSGSDSRRRITTKREPRLKSEVSNRAPLNSTFRRGYREKPYAIRARTCCHHARGTARIP